MAAEVVVELGGGDTAIAVVHETFSRPSLIGAAGGAGDATGQLLWAGCRALCNFIICNSESWRGSTIVELGCGAGLAGAVAARYAARVLLTDGAPDALLLARKTVAANARATGGLSAATDAVTYDWDAPAEMPLAQADFVIAAEVVYPSSLPSSMARMFGAAAALLQEAGSANAAVAAGAAGVPAGPAAAAIGQGSGCPCIAPGAMVMAYVERQPGSTLLMLHAAWGAGLAWEVRPWASYTHVAPLLDATIIIFRHRRKAQSSRVPAAAMNNDAPGGHFVAADELEQGAEVVVDGHAFRASHAVAVHPQAVARVLALLDAISETTGTVDEAVDAAHPSGELAHWRGFHDLLTTHFPCVVPSIRSALVAQREREDEAADWGPPPPP
jgi:SAM-dependent methyltransferase